MTQIKFYVGKGNDLRSRLLLACQLTHKAREQNMHVYIHADSDATLQRIDDLLWEFREESFIPHEMAPCKAVPVEMGYDYEPIEQCDYLINLSNERPSFFSRFERMAEILNQNDDILTKGRDRYRFYQDRGYKLDYHIL